MGFVADLNANARKLAERAINGIVERLAPSRRVANVAEAAVQASKRAVAVRSASVPPPIVPGAGDRRWTGNQVKGSVDADQQRIIQSIDARYGRAFSRTGPTPAAYAQYPEITLDLIARVHTHVQRNGWLWDKADLDRRIVREHEHLHPADRQRRAWIFSTYPRLLPRNDTRLAHLVRNAVAAALDELDGFDSSVSELQVANASGAALGEVVWKPRRLRIVTGPRQSLLVESETVSSIESIPLRSVAYDVDENRPYVNQGGWGWVDPFQDPAGRPLRKAVYHVGYGDEDARLRGYGFAAHHIHWLSRLTWEKAASLIELYGLSTPYLQPESEAAQISDEDRASAEVALADLGKGIPTILERRLGEIKTTPVPSALTPIHSMWVGYCNASLSKLVTGQTLTMETSGVGSYAVGNVHADSQEAVQRIDARLTEGTVNSQLLRYLVELNAVAWARAFSPYCAGEECSPEAINQCVPRLRWDVSRKLDKPERLKMFLDAKVLGLAIDPDQVREEMDFRAPLEDTVSAPAPDPLATSPQVDERAA